MAMSSDRVIRSMNGLTQIGASVWPTKMFAEYELRALLAEVQQSIEDIIESQKKSCAGFPIQHEETKNELKKESPDDNPPRKVFAVLGDKPRYSCENDDS